MCNFNARVHISKFTEIHSYIFNSRIGCQFKGIGNPEFSSITHGVYTKTELASVLTRTLTQLKTFGPNTTFDVSFVGEMLKITYASATSASRKYIVFQSEYMANSLGFSKQITDPITTVSGSFTATSAIQLEKPFTGNLIVECPSLGGQIQCYDSTTKSKHQVIASIPSLKQQNQSYVYQNNSPIYLDLNNKYEINLRQISSRVLLWNNTPLPIENNGCWITLSIK